MEQQERTWLTTGQAAELCAVTPATVLNWIRKGRLVGVRTAGGHYRIKRRELESLLPDDVGSHWHLPEHHAHQARPLRCWEYMSDGGVLREGCYSCVVYTVRAAWCFRIAKLGSESGGAPTLCPTTCDNCSYYRRTMGMPTNVLVATSDQGLIQQLSSHENKSIALRFARNAYEASTTVQSFPPAFAVVDQDGLTVGDGDLLESLANDPRLPGLKVIVAVPNGTAQVLGNGNGRRVVARVIEKPFGLHEIAAVIESFPVETMVPEEPGSSDLLSVGGSPMIMVQQVGTAGEAKVDDDGFLRTMASWSRLAAETLAEEHDIAPLTEEHWRVIEFVQEYYRTHGKGPPVVKVHKATGLTSADICRLFPCGMVKGAYRLAGLPRPPGCS